MFRYPSRQHCSNVILFLLVFTTFGYFYNGAAWNHLSRINTIFSFVEPGTPDHLSFRINRFIVDPINGKNTGDWASFEGNFYSNKAPGIALLAIPFYWTLYHLEKIVGLDPISEFLTFFNVYIIHLIVTVLPVSVAALFFNKTLRIHCGAGIFQSTLLTVTLFWSTLLFPYSSQLWGHATSAAFLILAFYFYLSNSSRALFYSGFFIGLAVLTEYSSVITLTIFAIGQIYRKNLIRLIYLALGGSLPFLAFISYHKICFGSFFTIANFFNNPYFLTQDALGGIFDGFSTSALWGLTFSGYRGLFFYMPILLLIIPAFYFLLTQKSTFLFWMCLGNIVGFFIMNLSFNGWHGGACIGPRYQIPALPFYIIFLRILPDTGRYRLFQIILLIPAFLNMFLSTAISPLVKQDITNPLLGYFHDFRLLLSGKPDILHPHVLPIRLQTVDSSIVQKYSSFNLGTLAGISDSGSLILWGVIFCTLLLLFVNYKVFLESSQ